MNNRKELKAMLKATTKPQPIKEIKCKYGKTHRCNLGCNECLRRVNKFE
jgi:hypothetical protein